MGSGVGTELRFTPQATEFVVRFSLVLALGGI